MGGELPPEAGSPPPAARAGAQGEREEGPKQGDRAGHQTAGGGCHGRQGGLRARGREPHQVSTGLIIEEIIQYCYKSR